MMDEKRSLYRRTIDTLGDSVSEISQKVRHMQQGMQTVEEEGQLLPPPLAVQIRQLAQQLENLTNLASVQEADFATAATTQNVLLDHDTVMLLLSQVDAQTLSSAVGVCRVWQNAGADVMQARAWRVEYHAKLKLTHGFRINGVVQVREPRYVAHLSNEELLLCDMGNNRLLGLQLANGRVRQLASVRSKTLGTLPRSACVFRDWLIVACCKSLHRFSIERPSNRDGTQLNLHTSLGRCYFKKPSAPVVGGSWSEAPGPVGPIEDSLEALQHVVCGQRNGKAAIIFATESVSQGRVLAFDLGLRFLFQFGEKLKFPTGLAINFETLFVSSDYWIDAFDLQGTELRRFQVGTSPCYSPSIAGLGDAILVLSFSTVMVISTKDAKLIHSLKLPNDPRSGAQICTDGKSRAYVIDAGWSHAGCAPPGQALTPPAVHVLCLRQAASF